MSNPLISVVIAAYNEEKNIERCISSIFNQTYKNIEVIAINDGSKDNTEKLLRELSQKYNLKYITIKNSGVSNARNIGLKNVSGEWIVFCDADDTYYCDAFELMLQAAIESKCTLVQGGLNRCNNRCIDTREFVIPSNVLQKCILSYEAKLPEEFEINFDWHLRLSTHGVYGKLIKRKLVEGMEFDSSLKLGEDLLFFFQLSLRCNEACVITKDVYEVSENVNSSTRRYNESMLGAADKFCIKMKDVLIKNNIYYSLKNEYNYQVFLHLMLAINVTFLHKDCNAPIFSRHKGLTKFLNKDYYKDALWAQIKKSNSVRQKLAFLALRCHFAILYIIYFDYILKNEK